MQILNLEEFAGTGKPGADRIQITGENPALTMWLKVHCAQLITGDVTDRKVVTDFAQHLALGATDVATCGFQVVINDVTN
ncbi:hypothetical protein ROG8370_01995 [Roseovarius gaetbuli]|uniref:Uncharacterized protein n=1 Tax=Roseovarius gaetbuli TaxID=1356575 RepID=A0A1X6ZB26_9RHOB|nr:hypothetical protein [Roseovarius gaetbuli]SLN46059.1 hypothetical protein ROG8370_01995 [Roseovarius gaetbuli]